MKPLISLMAVVCILSVISVNIDEKKTVDVKSGTDQYDYQEGLDKNYKPHGCFRYYDEQERLVSKCEFRHGVLIYDCQFDPETGEKIYEAVEDSTYNLVQVYPKGRPYGHIEYTMDDYLRDNQEQIKKAKEDERVEKECLSTKP